MSKETNSTKTSKNSNTITEKKLKTNTWTWSIIGYAFLITLFSIVFIWVNFVNIENGILTFGMKDLNELEIWTTLLIAAISFLVKRIVTLSIEWKKYNSEKEFYNGEIEDFSRHLIANINILKRLDEEIEDNNKQYKKIGYIHFTNLKVPHDSILLSNIPMEHSLFDNLNAIARLKVNIRNINNSADYLEHLAKNNCDINELHRAIKWEIRRHIALWVRVKLFPKQVEISKLYSNGEIQNLIEQLAKELVYIKDDNSEKNEEKEKKNLKYVEENIKEHIKDRNEIRDILIFKFR